MAIRNISDTARWVAHYRALESERPDAVFKDPFARQLAGDRGALIDRSVGESERMAVALVVRTKVLDDLIQSIVAAENIDLVLNLAAGLDTRPLRLDLPAALRWIEVDLPDLIGFKNDELATARPRCRLERVALDLSDRPARQALFAQIARENARILVITEGLLVYLEPDQVDELAADLRAMPNLVAWLYDHISARVTQMITQSGGKVLADGGSTLKFAPPGPQYFESRGWKIARYRAIVEEAVKIGRPMPGTGFFRILAALSPRIRREGQLMSGIVELLPNAERRDRSPDRRDR